MNTIEKVKKMIAEQLCVSVDDIKDDANIIEDLGADSLDVVELLMGVEEEFGITVPEEDAVNIKTIGDVVKAIEAIK